MAALRDPFGRAQRRTDAHYAQFADALHTAGISSHATLNALARRLRRNALATLGLIVGLIAIDTWLITSLPPVLTLISALAGLWLLATALRTIAFLRRYRADLDNAASG